MIEANQSARAVQAVLCEQNIDAAVLFRPANTQYVSGFLAHVYSRAIIVVLAQDTATLVVPVLERDNARQMSWIDDVRDYGEFPVNGKMGPTDPWLLVAEALREGDYERVAVEKDFLPVGNAEFITKVLELDDLLDATGIVNQCRMVKQPYELDLIRRAATLADTGVGTTLEAIAVGKSELEIDGAGTQAIVSQATDLLPGMLVDASKALTASGTRSSDPHAASTTRRLERGDSVIHRRQVRIHGYGAESERTAFVEAQPEGKLLEIYRVMSAAQQAAVDAVGPGVPMSDIDRVARDIIAGAGYGDNFLHRVGHGLGLEVHELPFLRQDANDPLLPGMVVTIEPGIYVEGVGGVRHSDSVVVTETGNEVITYLPKPRL